jgi:hypothetical protein
MNANMYYGIQDQNNNNSNNNGERGVGYTYNNQANNNYDVVEQQGNRQVQAQGNLQYPQSGLTMADAHYDHQARVDIVLPENLKLAMILMAICCLLCFFIVLLVK